jgi:hypothetical protein
MTAEGWQNVQANLYHMGEHNKEDLAAALASEAYYKAEERFSEYMIEASVPPGLAKRLTPKQGRLTPAYARYKYKLVSGFDYDNAALARIEQNARHTFMEMDGDTLADLCLESIEKHNTCENGGWEVWIDRKGYHTVPVDLIDGASLEGED